MKVKAALPRAFKDGDSGQLGAFKAHFSASVGVPCVPGDEEVGADLAIDSFGWDSFLRGHAHQLASSVSQALVLS